MSGEAACALAVCVVVALASVGTTAELPVVVPAPRHMDWAEGEAAYTPVGGLTKVVVPPSCRTVAGGIDLLNGRLQTLGLAPLRVEEGRVTEPQESSGVVYLSVNPQADWASRLRDLPEPRAQGYRLLVGSEALFVLGHDVAGLYYGLVTLSHLVDEGGRIPRVAISDWPDQRIRGTYMAGSHDWENRIPYFASLKLNLVLFESGDLYRLEEPGIRDHWQKVFALCRRHFIEPVPELQSLGWGQHILRWVPEAAEGVWVEKRPFLVADGRVQSPDLPIAPAAAIVNPGFEEGAGGEIVGWDHDRNNQDEDAGNRAVITREEAHGGEACVHLTCEEKTTVRAWQDVDCQAGRRYEVSCRMKTRDVAGGVAYIEVYGLASPGGLGDLIGRHAPKVSGTHDWRPAATAFDTADYTRLRIYVRLQECTGTAWFDDVALAGVASPNPLANVLVTEASPVAVEDEAGAVTYEEGRDYGVVVPAMAYPYEGGEPLGIELLPGSRIEDGDTVLLSYNHAPAGSITACPSEPRYQEFMRRAVHDVIGHLGPRFLHIGHDEPRIMNRDKRCTDRGLSPGEIFVDDVEQMRSYVREADASVRLMMWDDAVNPYQNAPSLGMKDAARRIPRDIIICVWWYAERDWEDQIEASTRYFLDLGFDITGSPWFNPKNAYRWAETLYRHGNDNPHVLGSLYTSWGHDSEDPWGALAVTAEHAWTIDQPPFEEQ